MCFNRRVVGFVTLRYNKVGEYNCKLTKNNGETGVLINYTHWSGKERGKLFFEVPEGAQDVGIGFYKNGELAILVYKLEDKEIRKDYKIKWERNKGPWHKPRFIWQRPKFEEEGAVLKKMFYKSGDKWIEEKAKLEEKIKVQYDN